MASDVAPETGLEGLLAGDDCLSARDGRLWIEDVDVGRLANDFGTPLYVMSEQQLRLNAQRMVAAFATAWPEGQVLIMPSIKANLSLALRRVLNSEGMGCDTFGGAEMGIALNSGVDPALISLNGPTKSSCLIEWAISVGVRITLDSLDELQLAREAAVRLGRRATVRFRLRPWLAIHTQTEMFDGPLSIQEATQLYKPGIPTEALLALDPDTLSAPELDVTGIAVHIGRQGRDPEIWSRLGEWAGETSGVLHKAWEGWRPREIDLGGGFPVPRDPYGQASAQEGATRPLAPQIDEYASAMTAGLRRGLATTGLSGDGIRLEVEPGRSLYGNAGIHLARVLNVKEQFEPLRHTWVETDTSEVFLADVLFERNRWNVIAAERLGDAVEQTADVVGVSCNPDVIVPHVGLPAMRPGDVVAFLDTGAYQDANANNFNALARPGTVLVNGAETDWIKRPEAAGEATSRDRVPPRLGGPGIEIFGLDHVSVTCSDLDRSLAFYSDLLGIRLISRGDARDEAVRQITGLPGAALRWADLDIGEGRVLELIEYTSSPSTDGPVGFRHEGQGHLSMRVADAATAYEALVAAGVDVIAEPAKIDDPGIWLGCRCFYASDPDGMTIELIERPL